MQRITQLTVGEGFGAAQFVPAATRLAAAVVFTAVAFALAIAFRGAPVSFLLCAIMASVTLGGVWPGLLAIALSQVAFAFLVTYVAPSGPDEMPNLGRHFAFATAGLFIVAIASAHRRSTASAARRMLRIQDDERRRIARVMHDTTAQDLAALRMQLARLDRTATSLSDEARAVLLQIMEMTDQSLQGIRTDSFLLYAPEVQDEELLPALKWFAEGFTERSGIKTTLALPPALAALAPEVKTALFRVLQEALMNVVRHSGADRAHIVIRRERDLLVMEISDRGRGMAASAVRRDGTAALGVGIPGMRDSLRELGGRLEIESSEHGTTVRAVLPAGS